jgi:hypothetical protein
MVSGCETKEVGTREPGAEREADPGTPTPEKARGRGARSEAASEEQTGARKRYSFAIDGEPCDYSQLYSFSLDGARGRPAPGDVVHIDSLAVVLGPEGTYNFKTTPEEDGRLLLVAEDGSETVVGAAVGWTYKDDKRVVFNPLAKLTPGEVRRLRGVRLDGWPEGTAEKLEHIDPAGCCVTITDNAAQGELKTLPRLPPGLRYLSIDESSSEGMEDYSALAGQRELRFFRLDAGWSGAFDLALIAQNRRLRYLDLRMQDLANTEALSSLVELRGLNVSWCDDLTDISFARGMKALRRLAIQESGVTDLSPLGGLEHLEEINADKAPVGKLPAVPLPALRNLGVMSTKLSDEAVATFAASHPKCKIRHGWERMLHSALAEVTRIRVRSGGTCHHDPAREKTLFEVKEAEKVRQVVDGIRVDESGSGFHCMCCGEPSFEFYAGERLVATLGFHHGRSLRWPGGWPGDGLLTDESAGFICEWLADHGITGPNEERESEKRSAAALRRRWKRYWSIIPKPMQKSVYAAKSAEERVAAFEQGVPDPVARAELYLRLFGCDELSWNIYVGLDELLPETLLPGVAKADMAAAFRNVLADPAGANGAARWIFSERKWGETEPAVLQEVLPALAERAMAHPRRVSRRRTIASLGAIKGQSAIRVLRRVLAGEIKVRVLNDEDKDEPGGMVSFGPGDGDVPEKCSDRAHAALVLAELGDRESLPAIRRLAGEAEGDDKKIADKALRMLAGDE